MYHGNNIPKVLNKNSEFANIASKSKCIISIEYRNGQFVVYFPFSVYNFSKNLLSLNVLQNA